MKNPYLTSQEQENFIEDLDKIRSYNQTPYKQSKP